jgi:hypothetical protein
MGIKYERKQTGPFEGKLVSRGTIISIDDDDYVEVCRAYYSVVPLVVTADPSRIP